LGGLVLRHRFIHGVSLPERARSESHRHGRSL
jgi:hypothetical protein